MDIQKIIINIRTHEPDESTCYICKKNNIKRRVRREATTTTTAPALRALKVIVALLSEQGGWLC